jgi:hypothetical protein
LIQGRSIAVVQTRRSNVKTHAPCSTYRLNTLRLTIPAVPLAVATALSILRLPSMNYERNYRDRSKGKSLRRGSLLHHPSHKKKKKSP